MRRILIVLGICLAVFVPRAQAEISHQLFTDVLKQHVSDGKVDYKNLCRDQRLGLYLKEVAQTDPSGLSAKEEEALWFNAYNGYMLKIVCDHYPLKSLNQLHFGGIVTAELFRKTVWDKPIAVVGGKKYSLKTIDHNIIRIKFKDKRLQFGMACGAVSCPDLRPEAYEGAKLDAQLEDQTKKFFNDEDFNHFNLKKKRVKLSPLLNWNAKYFGTSLPEILGFVAKYVPSDIGESLKNHPEEWTVTYGKYDLAVNDKR